MDEPIPPAENVEDAMRRAAEAIRAMRHIPKDENAAQARVRACAAIAAQRELAEAARRTMVEAVAAKRTNGNGHSPPVEVVATSLSKEVLHALAEALVPFVKELIADAVAEPVARLAELEGKKGIAPLASRLAQLEQHAVKYEGIWDETKAYSAGSLITFQGGLWHCEDTNCGVRPGSGSSAWTLANKSRR